MRVLRAGYHISNAGGLLLDSSISTKLQAPRSALASGQLPGGLDATPWDLASSINSAMTANYEVLAIPEDEAPGDLERDDSDSIPRAAGAPATAAAAAAGASLMELAGGPGGGATSSGRQAPATKASRLGGPQLLQLDDLDVAARALGVAPELHDPAAELRDSFHRLSATGGGDVLQGSGPASPLRVSVTGLAGAGASGGLSPKPLLESPHSLRVSAPGSPSAATAGGASPLASPAAPGPRVVVPGSPGHVGGTTALLARMASMRASEGAPSPRTLRVMASTKKAALTQGAPGQATAALIPRGNPGDAGS